MATLYDIFKFNNIPYSELTDERHKKEIERWVEKIEKLDLKDRLLEMKDACINIRVFPPQPFDSPKFIIDNIPEDFFMKITQVVDAQT